VKTAIGGAYCGFQKCGNRFLALFSGMPSDVDGAFIGFPNSKGIGGRIFLSIDEQETFIPSKTAKNLAKSHSGLTFF
jgi:hypothetical protein